MKANVLKGKRKGANGDVITAIKSEGVETVVLEFEDGSIENYDFEDVEMLSE